MSFRPLSNSKHLYHHISCNCAKVLITMLFRKQSKQTKGGYLQGKIKIPRVKGKLRMEVQTVPAGDVDQDIADIHPCLVHVVRLGRPMR